MRELTIEQLADRMFASRYLRALSFRLAKPGEAEDLLQDTIIATVDAARRGGLQADRALLRFCTVIMQRLAFTRWNERQYEHLPTHNAENGPAEIIDTRPSSMPDYTGGDERLALVYQLVPYLSPLDQQVFRMIFIEELSVEETARRLRSDYHKIRNQRFHMLERLRNLVAAKTGLPVAEPATSLPLAA